MNSNASSPLAIETHALVRQFGVVRAVDGVDLEVRKGEIYGFLGPNGAGKTTVIRMLVTLLAPTGGRIMVAGYDVMREADQVRSRIGVALQEAALDNKQTGRELLRLQGQLYGLNRGEVAGRIAELSSLVDIGEAMDRLIGTYSGGMKRRLDLAAALVHEPTILFLDEPTTGLDPISRNTVWEEVDRINRELGMTIFLTTQYMEEADHLAQRVGIISQGRIVAEDTPGALKRSIGSDVIVVSLESEPETAAAACARVPGAVQVEAHGSELTVSVLDGAKVIGPVAIALNECGAAVREITLRTPTLDDVFLHYTGARMDADAEQGGEQSTEEEG